MKSFMIFLNIIMFVLVSLLIFIHLVHAPPEPDKILGETPSSPTNHPSGRFENDTPFKLPQVSEIAKKNLFHPDRGQKPEVAKTVIPPPKFENIELLATFKFGDKSGAIINDACTPAPSAAAPAPAQPPPPPGPPGTAPQPPPKKPTPKRIFFVNDTLPSGCILKKVEKNSIVLEFNGVEMPPIELNLNDKDSQKRGQAVTAMKITPPTTPQTAVKTAPPKPGTPGQPPEESADEAKEAPKAPPIPTRRPSRFSAPPSK